MNMTCVEYVNNVRLEKAVELFEQGNTSILEVSLSVGFHNLSYFHRAFKNKYGMTPRSFINDSNKKCAKHGKYLKSKKNRKKHLHEQKKCGKIAQQ